MYKLLLDRVADSGALLGVVWGESGGAARQNGRGSHVNARGNSDQTTSRPAPHRPPPPAGTLHKYIPVLYFRPVTRFGLPSFQCLTHASNAALLPRPEMRALPLPQRSGQQR
ncbi:hypothetical protein E2C01_065436 [Portunus trituberculatus]|uniref:Uncharacterized protein n=1 Tax=Portunus trituberculatus TaxID=210409 RepID=A0A5B7HMK3_PORTR|nr:hypothetical protein [Portunus trituberculatus]